MNTPKGKGKLASAAKTKNGPTWNVLLVPGFKGKARIVKDEAACRRMGFTS